jgi:hypothetical protein
MSHDVSLSNVVWQVIGVLFIALLIVVIAKLLNDETLKPSKPV